MRVSFGRFELDQDRRALLLDGREQALQPLVFDLLVYLAQHHERVVPKDELLEKLWPGTVVTDGSLQRAVSLLRGVLRDGGSADAVQTHARRGYRFNFPTAEATPPPLPTESPRALLRAGLWEEALAAFAASDQAFLTPEDWEAWGDAAYGSGRPEDSVAPLERAVSAFEARGDHESAARAALLLTNVKLEGRELAIARAWHARATTLLRDRPESKPHGFAECLAARLAIFESNLDECRARAAAAIAIAERQDCPDVRAWGLIYGGHALIAQGEVRKGLSMHDEAGAAALAGRITRFASGIVFCSVIWAYLHLGDHHRAGQWTDEFSRWCERHGGYAFPALCRLHRSEVLVARGELANAELEVQAARQELSRSGPYAVGDACRVLGEIRLYLGDLEGADAAFREAHRLGWNPQPGMGLLLALRGQSVAAVKQLESALLTTNWSDGQRRGVILAVLARLAAMDGQVERAKLALSELESSAPELRFSSTCEAETTRAKGELAWAEGDRARAEPLLRGAIASWLKTNAPVHAAHVRLRLCELLLEASDAVTAELELDAAEVVFRDISAAGLLERCQELRARLA